MTDWDSFVEHTPETDARTGEPIIHIEYPGYPGALAPETITVPVEVLRRLHQEAVGAAYDDGRSDMARVHLLGSADEDDPTGVARWPTFLARLQEQAT